MDLVIDIQCCKDAKKNSLLKEIAVLTVEGDHVAHWIVLPPYSAKKLPSEVRRENQWLAKNYHGLDWDDGFVYKSALYRNLISITKNFGRVFVRGGEKKKLLENIISNEIINLEGDEDHPAFHDLKWIDSFCMYHSSKLNHISYRCAFNNAVRLRNWLREQPKDSTSLHDEQFRDFTDTLFDLGSFGGCFSG